ncbi:hypothetical protein EVAR_19998_1 [Eumeta japonica]|uniref:Uncharacterized protein n=1 Tax=Eumeta variegata TaxID=151549 RepID=A0A4C1V9F0_EUMVA|nr:hypothetical protein EVAR_19998_1 [Eumeta japonica]
MIFGCETSIDAVREEDRLVCRVGDLHDTVYRHSIERISVSCSGNGTESSDIEADSTWKSIYVEKQTLWIVDSATWTNSTAGRRHAGRFVSCITRRRSAAMHPVAGKTGDGKYESGFLSHIADAVLELSGLSHKNARAFVHAATPLTPIAISYYSLDLIE